MAAARYTIDVQVLGAWRHSVGPVVAFTLSSAPNVIHLAFGAE